MGAQRQAAGEPLEQGETDHIASTARCQQTGTAAMHACVLHTTGRALLRRYCAGCVCEVGGRGWGRSARQQASRRGKVGAVAAFTRAMAPK